MASVLGKRARATDSSKASISSRVKRRTLVSVVSDKTAEPCIGNLEYGNVEHDGVALDTLDNLFQSSSCLLPSNDTVGGRRIALSPRNANGQSKPHEERSTDKKSTQLPTPKTPRHRDALTKRIPVTPRHLVGLVGKPLTPRTPRTPLTPSNAPTVYHCARQLFARSADPGRLVGREEERKELHEFIQKGINSKSGRCMYVSGPPGTGKSALVSEVCRDIQGIAQVKTAHINCMSAKTSGDIYAKLIEDLVGDENTSENHEMVLLRSMFLSKKRSSDCVYVVTLDEIDHLLTLDPEILYTLFDWSLQRSSRLVVIGIANALDLTDRFLPRLKAKNLKPVLLPFLPYSASQITSVITTKLKSLYLDNDFPPSDFIPFLQPGAIQLCSKKVASQTGDLRKAFDIVRRAIDLIETETKQQHQSDFATQAVQKSPSRNPLGENPNLSSPTLPYLSLASLTALTAPRATIAHVSGVSAAALSNGTSQRLQSLNLQQKAALCTLISYQKSTRQVVSSIFATPTKTNIAAPTIPELYGTYCMLCKRENALHPLTGTEFADVISGLETLGLVGEEGGGRGFGVEGRTPSRKRKGIWEEKKLLSLVDEREVRGVLDRLGGGILRGLLGGED